MATPAVFVHPAHCARRQTILDDIQAAMREIVAIHDSEFKAILVGDFNTAEETQARLKVCREHKDALMEQLRVHVRSHGC